MTVPANLNVLKNHRYADIFPMMNEDDFNRLMEDVRENGLQEPIWLYEGKILDGRNRYKSCQKLGIVPELRSYQGSEPLKFVMSLNLARRHLNSSQCAFVALEVERVLAEEAKERQIRTAENREKAEILVVEFFPQQEPEEKSREKAASIIGHRVNSATC